MIRPPRMNLRDLIIRGACAAAIAALPHAARAADASTWSQDTKSAVRLIAGANEKDAKSAPLRAGIEIKMEPGWHTYWRYPGDSGVPPRFSFAGSDNIKAATVRSWARRGQLHPMGLDEKARPLYDRNHLLRLRS